MRILAFEDTFDIEALLVSSGVDLSGSVIEQKWTTEGPLEVIDEFSPDILLLDYFIPPYTGLEVLKMLNESVASGQISRPNVVIGMSSENKANRILRENGADQVIIKFKLAELPLWSRK